MSATLSALTPGTCSMCAQTFEPSAFALLSGKMPSRCPACQEKMCNAIRCADASREAAAKRTVAPWQTLCPEDYRNTDPDLLPCPTILGLVRQWMNMSEAEQGAGLGLVGNTGLAKTRLAYYALKQFWQQGVTCMAADHYLIASLVQTKMFGHPEEKWPADDALDEMTRCRVFLFDDIGKGERTEHVDAEICRQIDLRTKHKRMLLWTINGGGPWLRARLGPDRGPPTVRRLATTWIIDADNKQLKPPRL